MRPIVKLGEICDVISGQSPESQFYNEKGEGLPFFQGKTEFTDRYIGKPRVWTTKTTKESIKNDILMSVRAPVGPVNINGFDKICIGRGLCAIRPGKLVDLDYVFDYLLGIQDKISGNTGAVFASINRKDIESIEIPLPPLETQKAIVAKLDQIFAELDQTKSEIQKNLDNTDELWKSALNQAFQGDWEMKKLGDCVKIIGGGTPSKNNKSYYENGQISWATVRDMNEDIIKETELKITELGLKNSSSNVVPKEGIVIATRVGLGKVCYLDKDTAINQDLKGIIPQKNIIKEYLFYFFKNIAEFIVSKGTGATVKGVSLDFVKNIELPVPPLSEQEKIVELLDQVSKEVKALKSQYQSQLDNLEELKKSVLDKAFRGEMGE